MGKRRTEIVNTFDITMFSFNKAEIEFYNSI